MEPVYLVGPRGTQDCAALAELWAGPHGNTPFIIKLEHRSFHNKVPPFLLFRISLMRKVQGYSGGL